MIRIAFRYGVFFLLIFAGMPTVTKSEEAQSALLRSPKVGGVKVLPDVLVGATRGGKFKGNNIYEQVPSAKQRLVRISGAKQFTSYFKVQNDTRGYNAPAYSLFAVGGKKTTRSHKVTYFNQSGSNVTGAVSRGRYVLNLPANSERLLRQTVSVSKSGLGSPAKFNLKATRSGSRVSDAAEVSLRKR